ncbi:15971_t:CDS:2 [Dentiscutata heterogama]|uniref:15971_t:CDS:1 n=1 Tax=Dentiscutata heterogama TaxID=1316150 RepID=A0ACA9L558_9GLOM|nr:15971_t:CDS:2 [Dentiscutata heterogama]
MSSNYLCVKIAEYLSGLKTEHIMVATLIYQEFEKNSWICKNELRGIVNRAVNLVKRSTTIDFEHSERLIQIISQEDNKFYELIYVEYSQIVHTKQKKDDVKVKLWCEANDEMFWAHKSHRLEK